MATVERSTGSTEGDQKEKMLSPSEEDSPLVLNDTSAPLNFSELTPCQFGISVQSFTPTPLSNSKDKSRLAQIKARRRSSIGVRGSPETNSLIRFMAQQRMKTPKTFQTPEPVRNSPFLPQVTSSLRQKMASFQTLMDVDESEVCDPVPRQDRSTGGCIKTRDYLSDGNGLDGEKENHPPLMTPAPSKRRRLGPRETCELEIRETNAPILHFTLKEQKGDEEPVKKVVTQGVLTSSEPVAQAVLISPPFHADFEGQACSLTKTQQDVVFEFQSHSQPPPDDLAAASPACPASSFHIPSLPSLLEMKPTGEDDSTGKSTVKSKKKSVRFGVPLSPEFFDKNQPPSTPLQKGGTPARAPTPGGSLQLRSLLKTPQRSESQTPQAQPNFSSPTAFGSSPTLSVPRNRRMLSSGGEDEDEDEKTVFSPVEEIDCAVMSDAGTKPRAASQMDALGELTSLPEQEKECEADVEAPAPAQSRNQRRKQPEESKPVKTLTRSAAKMASGKMKDGVFELQSHSQPDDPAAASAARPASSFHIPSLPSLLEIKPTGEDDSTGKSTVKSKKKSVRFGVPLSPEFFDKNQPPSTPLQKGGTPARAPTPGGSLQLRSLLKTPQRSESQTPQAQPNFSSPTAFGSSPTLSVPRNRRMLSSGGEDEDEKTVFSPVEEIDCAVMSDAEWDIKPLNLNTAFHEESQSLLLTESETKPSTTFQLDALDELTSVAEQEKQCEADVEAPAPSRNQRRKQPGPERESTSEAPARSSSRKRKQPEESEPVKRSTRSAAKTASGKMKMTSTAARRWTRDVDRSLYGSRAYASKNPTLSPITERLSFITQAPAAQHTPSVSCTAPNHETHLDPVVTNDSQQMGDLILTNALESPSEDSITSSDSSKESTRSRRAGPRAGGRGLRKRKVSVADDMLLHEETLGQTGGKTEEHCEDQTTTNLEASRETSLTHTVPEQGSADTELYGQTSTDTHCTDSDGKLESHGSLDAPTSDTLSLPLESPQRKTKQGRRSCANSSVLQEQGKQAEQHQTSHEVEEREQGDQAPNQQESIRSGSDSQEEGGAANLEFAPWQTDFNFEDVFKPVATRGKRSVRRSLRNQSNAEHSSDSAGLAWLSQTPPDSSKEARRRTRGRRLSAAPPAQPSLPEETQDHAS